jgi:hypothetical protein
VSGRPSWGGRFRLKPRVGIDHAEQLEGRTPKFLSVGVRSKEAIVHRLFDVDTDANESAKPVAPKARRAPETRQNGAPFLVLRRGKSV